MFRSLMDRVRSLSLSLLTSKGVRVVGAVLTACRVQVLESHPMCAKRAACMQAHITGLPQDVLNSPMGPMLVQMLQPALQSQLGNATASGIATPAFQPAAPTAPSAPATSAATPATHPSTSASSSQSSRSCQNGMVAGRRKYKATLEEEFAKVMAEGQTDANKAAVEAVKRVSALVKEGMVEAPESQS